MSGEIIQQFRRLQEGYIPVPVYRKNLLPEDFQNDRFIELTRQAVAYLRPELITQQLNVFHNWESHPFDLIEETLASYLITLRKHTYQSENSAKISTGKIAVYRGIPVTPNAFLLEIVTEMIINFGEGPKFFNTATGICDFVQVVGAHVTENNLMIRQLKSV